ncbi:uncharacterized protein LOC113874233 [Abrus precatorius]|uniref:Uncharacterized protein LOC113874233 n=1 Tax=Abrus precatorius TaxID=3816 RepID=A0A8B8MKY0_ABRPR|nr:uncharacterized protein LOC113874233 [Abrus precatorius]
MGSVTEEQLVQMVRDFIEAESSEQVPTSDNSLSYQNHNPTCLLTLQQILRETTDIEVEVLQKILKHLKSVEFANDPTNLKKLIVVKLKMDGYEASLCKTSWDFTFDRCNSFQFSGDYEYVDVMVGEKGGVIERRLMVDIDFKSQFELAKPTREYKELRDTLPCVFVGTEEKLAKLNSLLCSAAKESLKEKGFHIPPWRKVTYMQSKWLSKNCEKKYPSYMSNVDLESTQMNI